MSQHIVTGISVRHQQNTIKNVESTSPYKEKSMNYTDSISKPFSPYLKKTQVVQNKHICFREDRELCPKLKM